MLNLPSDRASQVHSSNKSDRALAPSTTPAEQFLRLVFVEGTTVLLPLLQMTEVLTLSPGHITPMPHLPAWVMGVYNWRGEILWMVDLGHLCGFTPWYAESSHLSTMSAVVLNRLDQSRSTAARIPMLGLVVNQIDDIEWCDPSTIQLLPSSTTPPGLTPFLRGFRWEAAGEMQAVLNGDAILAAMPKA